MLKGVDDPRFPLVPQRVVADLRYVYRRKFRNVFSWVHFFELAESSPFSLEGTYLGFPTGS